MTGAAVVIPLAILRAYERTDYRVEAERGPFILRIGTPSQAVRDLHAAFGVSSSVFVTACNPFGRRLSDEENAQSMQRLRDWLDARAIRWIAGEGRGEDEGWAPEPSVLALGAAVADATALCVEFEQNAVVVIGEDAVPRLAFHPRAGLPQA